LGVLVHISPHEFATTIAGAKYGDQKKIALALSLRYDQTPGEPELQAELPWLATMIKELEALAAQMTPIPRHHLRSLVAHYVQKHVAQSAKEPTSGDLEAQL
jgi:hypothetical protein